MLSTIEQKYYDSRDILETGYLIYGRYFMLKVIDEILFILSIQEEYLKKNYKGSIPSGFFCYTYAIHKILFPLFGTIGFLIKRIEGVNDSGNLYGIIPLEDISSRLIVTYSKDNTLVVQKVKLAVDLLPGTFTLDNLPLRHLLQILMSLRKYVKSSIKQELKVYGDNKLHWRTLKIDRGRQGSVK